MVRLVQNRGLHEDCSRGCVLQKWYTTKVMGMLPRLVYPLQISDLLGLCGARPLKRQNCCCALPDAVETLNGLLLLAGSSTCALQKALQHRFDVEACMAGII